MGSKEASASVSKDAEVMLKLGSTPDKCEQYRLMRDAMRRGLSESLVIQLLVKVHDVLNVVGAGSATVATFGLILPGSLLWCVRNVLLGSVLGAAFCFPLGWIHLLLIEKANEENLDFNPDSDRTGEAKSDVGAAIERLEGNLKAK